MEIVVKMVWKSRAAGTTSLDRPTEHLLERPRLILPTRGTQTAINLVVKIRHAVHACRLDRLAIRDDRLARFGETHSRAFGQPAVEIACAGENVAQRQKIDAHLIRLIAK